MVWPFGNRFALLLHRTIHHYFPIGIRHKHIRFHRHQYWKSKWSQFKEELWIKELQKGV